MVVLIKNSKSQRPDRELTRAETVTIVNRMLDRKVDKAYVDTNVRSIISFTDLTNVYWAYHNYERLSNKEERWTKHWRPY